MASLWKVPDAGTAYSDWTYQYATGWHLPNPIYLVYTLSASVAMDALIMLDERRWVGLSLSLLKVGGCAFRSWEQGRL
jgi:hypothetical protein